MRISIILYGIFSDFDKITNTIFFLSENNNERFFFAKITILILICIQVESVRPIIWTIFYCGSIIMRKLSEQTQRNHHLPVNTHIYITSKHHQKY